jgi:peptidyl-prolyl cis-trans isomerase B (cyclophilin B)
LSRLYVPAFGFLLALVFVLAACGGSDKKTTSSDSTPFASGADTAAASCGPSSSKIASIQRNNQRNFPAPPARVIDPAKSYIATMKTDKGDITIELAAADAPNTVNNFVFLSCTGFYDGLTFHRYEPGFVIQGGDPRGNGTGGPGYIFDNEISPKLRHNTAGILSMANAGPNTNGSQFFITLASAPHLDNGYSAFGKVTGGLNAVNAIRVGDKIQSVSVQER